MVFPAWAVGRTAVVPSGRRSVWSGASFVLARVSERPGCATTTSAAAQLPPALVVAKQARLVTGLSSAVSNVVRLVTWKAIEPPGARSLGPQATDPAAR